MIKFPTLSTNIEGITMNEIVHTILDGMEIRYTTEIEDSIESFSFHVDLEEASVRGIIGINYEEAETYISLHIPSIIPELKRIKISEFFSRINNEDTLGAFVLDFNDGYMGYRTCFCFDELNDDQYQNILLKYFSHVYHQLEHYLESILECNFGEKEPAEILNELEFQVDPRLN